MPPVEVLCDRSQGSEGRRLCKGDRGGAYPPSRNPVWLGAVTAIGPYRIPNVKLEAFSAYINRAMAAAFKGYGTPQVTFAGESQMDRIAHELSIDPVELRLTNFLDKGDVLHKGQRLHSVNVMDFLCATP